MQGNANEIMDFAEWFDKQPAKHLVWIPGNHSCGFEAQYPHSLNWIKSKSPRTNVLLNSGVKLEGINIWGSPVTPWFHNWSYNVLRGAAIRRYWDMIPRDTNIVVTHGPPFNVLDTVNPGSWQEDKVGCMDLAHAISEIKPKYMIFGHIHEGYGIKRKANTTFINASIMNSDYYPVNVPITFEY